MARRYLPFNCLHPLKILLGTVDISTLRLVLTTLLPLVMERLGDKDRVQIKARDSIALLGGYSFKSGSASVVTTRSRDGKGPETPNMIFEKLLKEQGLASKAWKIREQVRSHLEEISEFPLIQPSQS